MAIHGNVYLVGAGPGDPDLLTLKAARLLASADCVIYDRLVSDGVLALVNPEARRHYVGKRAHHHAMDQASINELLIEAAGRYRCVVRLKGGDPFVFGRGGEEALALLDAGIHCDIVPGITAAQACCAASGIPLTFRGIARSVRYLTGHLMHDAPWHHGDGVFTAESETLVIYMGLENVDSIVAGLLRDGRDPTTPAAIIENGTLPTQRQITSYLSALPKDVRRHRVQAPALIIVGGVVDMAVPAAAVSPGLAFDTEPSHVCA